MKFSLKQKMRVISFGQIVFIALILVFVFGIRNRLSEVQKVENDSQQANEAILNFAFLAEGFLAENIGIEDVQRDYTRLNTLNHFTSNNIRTIWQEIESVDLLRKENTALKTKVLDLTDFSIQQSNNYIADVAGKLADAQKRSQVSVLERLVIQGASVNTNSNHTIRLLFEQMAKEIQSRGQLLEYLDIAIENASIDVERLAKTPFAQLPVHARNANIQIKEITKEYIGNLEAINLKRTSMNSMLNELFRESQDLVIESTHENFAAINDRMLMVIVFVLIISAIIMGINVWIRRSIFNDVGGEPAKVAELVKQMAAGGCHCLMLHCASERGITMSVFFF